MTRPILAALAVTGLLMSGCGGDDPAADAGPASTTRAVDAEATDPEGSTTTVGDDSETDAGGEGDLTPGGTALSWGDRAVVEQTTFDDEVARVAVTVTEVERSSVDALAAAGVDVSDEVADQVPYFVRYTLENLTDVDLSGLAVGASLGGELADGASAGRLVVIGFDACESDVFADGSGVGDVAEGCKVLLSDPGVDLVAIRWLGVLSEPITWSE